jgi:hypothetical protein
MGRAMEKSELPCSVDETIAAEEMLETRGLIGELRIAGREIEKCRGN